jgi:hypothetical protein
MIADSLTTFAKYLLSHVYIEKVYKDLFIDYFGALINAYQSSSDSWEECLEAFIKNGMKLQEIGHCDDSSCYVKWEHGSSNTMSKKLVEPVGECH